MAAEAKVNKKDERPPKRPNTICAGSNTKSPSSLKLMMLTLLRWSPATVPPSPRSRKLSRRTSTRGTRSSASTGAEASSATSPTRVSLSSRRRRPASWRRNKAKPNKV